MLLVWNTCSEPSDQLAIYPQGSYHYRSYNADGINIVEGWFTMEMDSSGFISGEWHFDAVGYPENIGPQVGDGVLLGGIDRDTIWIELNPHFVDNNLQLIGTLEEDNYRGKWYWISFPGITAEGDFIATYQQ